MKSIFATLVFLLVAPSLFSQQYSRVRVYANNEELDQLIKAGVCLDHGRHKENTWIETDLSSNDITILRKQDVRYEIIIEDVVSHYINQVEERALRAVPTCNQFPNEYASPAHFKLGSMGGYPTYAQIMSELDSMYILYPSLVKQKTAIGAYITTDGNTIDWMKISDNPGTDESEPEILFTALHHAREPASVTQLLYFMWYLLENYGTNAEVTFLLDNTEIYFIPVVNPDGYLYNQTTNPTGGGMWRKNRKNNGGGTYGVDLNRNYSYQWGVSGTSSTPSSDVYLGPSAFSEPETKAVRDFVYAHNFSMALNYHTYGNLLLYPYGYANVAATDKNYYDAITARMVCDNSFANAQSVELYPAAGDSDDWMYGDTVAKPRVFAMTPEVGSDSYGFWPPSGQITNLAKDNLRPNMTALNLLHYYCEATDASEVVFRSTGLTHYFKFNLQKLGLKDTGTSTVTLIPLTTSAITGVGSAKTYTNIAGYASLKDSISFTLNTGTTGGTMLQFVLQTTNAAGIVNDTVIKYYGQPVPLFSSDFTTLSGFTNSGFSITTSDFVSPGSCLTESPTGNYTAYANKNITTPDITIPTTAWFAQLRFYAHWDIEDRFDYAQVLISNNSGASYTPLCGRYTTPGAPDQDQNDPIYDDLMTDWVMEEINLNAYIGQTVRIRLAFKSDAGVEKDGFYMDDMVLEIIDPLSVNEIDAKNGLRIWPNPANDFLNITSPGGNGVFKLCDNTGRIVKSGNVHAGNNQVQLSALAEGHYMLLFAGADGINMNYKIMVTR